MDVITCIYAEATLAQYIQTGRTRYTSLVFGRDSILSPGMVGSKQGDVTCDFSCQLDATTPLTSYHLPVVTGSVGCNVLSAAFVKIVAR